ncbi:DUF983 domain-containing protein [Hephaestia sp. GCM10023244]|uniref:DUF983 domain-containing protein n=1 Tax=unclassified Hephaestia TaxID=2631281 RepID=UPI00207735C8|nr:DUF983 domain-containing protein [Hephaestia sp. MAHUQ-44]MCM8730486.1 DUF983 domain-containing protein [Hephaestia sp. MAHUQ-44]
MNEAGDPAGGPTPPAPAIAAIKGVCPRCGAPGLFAGIARFASHCRGCGLDYASFNVGDGPAAFLTLIIGALVVGLAVTLQLAIDPPLWLQMAIWIPITAIMVAGGLRIAKGLLLALEYRGAARDGRLSDA